MTPDDVRQKLETYLRAVREEQDLRNQLTGLSFYAADEKELQKVIAKQDQLIRGIENLRQEKMLPILNELAEFIAKSRGELSVKR